MRILVTGSAGFIGFHLCRRLLAEGHEVTGLDGMTSYYDVALKRRRHAVLATSSNAFRAHEGLLEDMDALTGLIAACDPEIVVHLAAQAGVRYAMEAPRAYLDANLVGTFNLIEALKGRALHHFLLASTSSVYGAAAAVPFREEDAADHPLTLYAATKKACEAMAHAHAHLHRLPTTAFRFFTVYGPWGRPDMALYRFVAAIEAGDPITIYGDGEQERDFTYIDDLIEAVLRLMAAPPGSAGGAGLAAGVSPVAPYRVVNIGAGRPVRLNAFIDVVERALGRRAQRRHVAAQPGDVPRTYACADRLEALTGYRPRTAIEEGVPAFVAWYRGEWP